tara:strand:- start:421 stop:966 length:546 start_codon:yes stop_codon:yes gene_type:complete
LIRTVYITFLLCCQLLGNNKTETFVSFEYWLSEEFKLFSFENAFLLQIDDDTINVSANSWFGELILEENIEFNDQTFLVNSLFNKILAEKNVPEEDLWINDYVLLDDKKIKVRYLFSTEEDSEKLFRMDIKEFNKDGDDNMVNNVILDHDLIKIWTNLDNKIKKLSFKYNNAAYIVEFNEE